MKNSNIVWRVGHSWLRPACFWALVCWWCLVLGPEAMGPGHLKERPLPGIRGSENPACTLSERNLGFQGTEQRAGGGLGPLFGGTDIICIPR